MRTVEAVLDITFALYHTKCDRQIVQTAVRQIRYQGILCFTTGSDLWIFGEDDNRQTVSLDDEDFELKEEGSLGQVAATREGTKDTIAAFLKALEGSISFALGQEGIYRVGDWSWIFAPALSVEPTGASSVLLQLHAVVVDGALHISIIVRSSELYPLLSSTTQKTVPIIMSPCGRCASVVPENSGSATSQVIDGEQWRSLVADSLATDNIELQANDDWIPILVSDGPGLECIAWPKILCFESRSLGSQQESPIADLQWKQWFDCFEDDFRHPLVTAVEWFNGVLESENVDTMATVDPDSNMTEPTPSQPIGNDSESQFATSPPFNQPVADHQAALAGIYPTPPDGLLHGSSSQQPSIDRIANTLHSDADVNHDMIMNIDDNSIQCATLQTLGGSSNYNADPHDIFGDVGDMDFGNEIVDDDFNYFDEPDERLAADHIIDVDINAHAEDGIALYLDEQRELERPSTSIFSGHDDLESDQKMIELSNSPDANQLDISEETATTHSAPVDSREELSLDSVSMNIKPEKPLSPFGIRERLLPPPIPASAVQTGNARQPSGHRNSLFAPVTFNEGLAMNGKYAIDPATNVAMPVGTTAAAASDKLIEDGLRRRYSNPRQKSPSHDRTHASDSEDESFETSASSSEEENSAKMPWQKHPRKRTALDSGPLVLQWSDNQIDYGNPSNEIMAELLDTLMLIIPPSRYSINLGLPTFPMKLHEHDDNATRLDWLISVADDLDISKEDLVYIAQIISEQAMTATNTTLQTWVSPIVRDPIFDESAIGAVRSLADSTLLSIFPHLGDCDLSMLVQTREPVMAVGSLGKVPLAITPGVQARPQRVDSVQLAPEYFSLPPPYVRVQRGPDSLEILPPALPFWPILNLGPVSGGKDVQVVAISPSNYDCHALVHNFMADLGAIYESRRLGSWNFVPMNDDSAKKTEATNVFRVTTDEDMSLAGILKAYSRASANLGKSLARCAHPHPHRTIVIFMVHPFTHPKIAHYLCACFWTLCKTYRTHISSAHRHLPHSDVVLQLLPTDILASSNDFVVLMEEQMAKIASDIHDRCPPSSTSFGGAKIPDLSIFSAPAIEIANSPPKRIAFQLSSDPPGDLLQEGSVLNLAYSISPDRLWLTAFWIDSTGRYQDTWSTPLRGRSFSDAAHEIWQRTLDILNGRDVTWRVFIAAADNVSQSGESSCWRSLAVSKVRKQAFQVTLLSVQLEPELQLVPPFANHAGAPGSGSGTGCLTPATTPQGASYTASPDGVAANAPPTPAPSEAVTSTADNEPDAHLVDVEDESWGLLLAPPFTSSSGSVEQEHVASGVLFKRGKLTEAGASGQLDALGVNLRWDLRIRPNGHVDEVPPRQAEGTLREVLKVFRNLGVLSKAKWLKDLDQWGRGREGSGLVPLHIAGALRGARALDGYL